MKIRDIFRDADQPWMYPFSQVKKDPVEGWYILWSEENPGYIPDPDLVNIGDLVSDISPSARPYWEVTGVFGHNIYLKPFGDNPFLTGIGAGGAKLGNFDFDVFTGEAEKKIIDQKLKRIHEKQYADYDDVAYILLGAQPFRFGPNGAEGGWYTATDWNTRGYNKNMSPQQIMMADARSLQNLGLEVPASALAGTLDPYKWTQLVKGTKELLPELKLPGENWKDPHTCARFILTHPQPQIRRRNAEAFRDLLHRQDEFSERLAALRKHVRFPEDRNSEEWEQARIKLHRLEENLRANWKDDPDIAELAYEIADKLYYSQHPTFKYPQFDAYWFTKELFINLAKDYCWTDILRKYLGTRDFTNRKYAVFGLEQCGDIEALIYVIETDTHPEPIGAALRGLRNLERGEVYGDYSSRARHGSIDLSLNGIFYRTLDDNLERLQNIVAFGDSDSYHRDELGKLIKNALIARKHFLEHGWWSSMF